MQNLITFSKSNDFVVLFGLFAKIEPIHKHLFRYRRMDYSAKKYYSKKIILEN